MTKDYNADDKTLTLKPLDGQKVKFRDIGLIKFGNSKEEPNFCDYSRAFTYNVISKSDDKTVITMHIQNKLKTDLLPNLTVSVKLLDNEGTIELIINDEKDMKIFKAPNSVNPRNFPEKEVTKDINSFITFTEIGENFKYTYHAENDQSKVYFTLDPQKLYYTKYLLFDSVSFNLNNKTKNPLFGIGERAGDLLFEDEDGGIHTRYTFD